jgi:hypothetical protein
MNMHIVTGSLSPDNSMLYFSGYKDKKAKYWLMKSDGTGLKEIIILQDELK